MEKLEEQIKKHINNIYDLNKEFEKYKTTIQTQLNINSKIIQENNFINELLSIKQQLNKNNDLNKTKKEKNIILEDTNKNKNMNNNNNISLNSDNDNNIEIIKEIKNKNNKIKPKKILI